MEKSNQEIRTFQQIERKVNRDMENWVVPVNNTDPKNNPVAFEYFKRVVEAIYVSAYESGRPRFMNKLNQQLMKIHQLGYFSIEHFLKQPESKKFQNDPQWQEVFLIVDPLKRVDQQFKTEHPDYGFSALYMNTEEWKHNSIGWEAPPESTSGSK